MRVPRFKIVYEYFATTGHVTPESVKLAMDGEEIPPIVSVWHGRDFVDVHMEMSLESVRWLEPLVKEGIASVERGITTDPELGGGHLAMVKMTFNPAKVEVVYQEERP